MELDVPPASTLVTGAGAVGASSVAANGVLDGIAVIEAATTIGAVGPLPPLRRHLTLAPLLPDPQLEPRGPVALSRRQQPGAEEAQLWEQRGRKP